MKPKLLIVGAGGHGSVVADAAIEQNTWSEIAFLDDNVNEPSIVNDIPVLGAIADIHKYSGQFGDLAIAIGDNILRMKLIEEFINSDFCLPVISHPKAIVSKNSEIGPGTFLAANAVINAGSTLGKGCIINTAATVDHDNILSDGVHVSPGAHLGGNVVVGKCSWIGIGASIREQVSIGENVVIGAGAAVVENVGNSLQMLGVPARPNEK